MPILDLSGITVYGPYTRKDGRKHVIYYSLVKAVRKTVSYPKHLMQQHLGRVLEDWETVDHIDEDFTNDDLDNLQILSRPDNCRKSFMNGEWRKCLECDTMVYRTPSRLENLTYGIFCSVKCGAAFKGDMIKQGIQNNR